MRTGCSRNRLQQKETCVGGGRWARRKGNTVDDCPWPGVRDLDRAGQREQHPDGGNSDSDIAWGKPLLHAHGGAPPLVVMEEVNFLPVAAQCCSEEGREIPVLDGPEIAADGL